MVRHLVSDGWVKDLGTQWESSQRLQVEIRANTCVCLCVFADLKKPSLFLVTDHKETALLWYKNIKCATSNKNV